MARRLPGGASPAPSFAAGLDDQEGREIVARWRRGDRRAFSDLFHTYRRLVHGVLYHLLPGDPELEDVVQSAFVEIFRSLDRFEGRARLSSWITRVTLHVGYHHLRHRKSRRADYDVLRAVPNLPDAGPRGDPLGVLEGREALERLQLLLRTLPPRKRTVFILNDLQGLPQEEIAEVVGTSLATVRTRLFYARREIWKKAAKDPVLASILGGREPSDSPGEAEGDG